MRQFQKAGKGDHPKSAQDFPFPYMLDFTLVELAWGTHKIHAEIQGSTFQVLKTINKANFINMLSGKAMVEQGDEPAEKRSRLEKEEEDEEEEEEKEQKQSSWNILRYDVQHCG